MPATARVLLLSLAAFLSAASLRAHNAPGSSVFLDFFRDHLRAELRLPLSELELSFRQPLLSTARAPDAHPGVTPDSPPLTPVEIRARVAQHRAALTAYLLAHLDPRSPDGRPWLVTVTALSVTAEEAIPDLVVHLRLTPPPGAPLRRFTLNYDAIVHEVINHIIFVSVRRDWDHAVFADHPEPLTSLRFFNKSLPVDRTGGSLWRGARHRLLAVIEHHPLRTSVFTLAPLLAVVTFAARLRRRSH